MELIIDSSGNHYKTRYKEDYCAKVTIQALRGNSVAQVGYANVLENAYPRQISQVELGNEQGGLVQVTVTWEYDNWKMTDLKEGFQKTIDSVIKRRIGQNSIDYWEGFERGV